MMLHYSSARSLRLSDRLYRSLLLAYPPAFREAYGPEMARVFRDCCREVYRGRGGRGLLGLWSSTLGDLALTAARERLAEAPRSERRVRWSGVAAMLGGTGWLLKGGTNVLGGPTWLEWGYAGLFLFPIGLLGLRARLGRQGGGLARCGGALACVALALLLASVLVGLASPGGFTPEPPLPVQLLLMTAMLSLLTSSLLLGAASLRMKTLPSLWSALPLAMALLAPVSLALGELLLTQFGEAAGELPIVLFGLGWLLLGYLLWSESSGKLGNTRLAGEG